MARYVARRVFQMIPLLFGISIVIFALTRAMPGDPRDVCAGRGPHISQDVCDRLIERFGLDEPLPVQYVLWLRAALEGDLGISYLSYRPVSELIVERLPATVELMGSAFLLAAILAFGLGVFSAVRHNTWFDHLGAGFSFLGIAMPVFWFGLILQMVFAVWLGWLPVSGRMTVGDGSFFDRLLHLVLPATVLSLRFVAGWSRHLRSSMIEVLRADFVRTARAKGLSERVVVWGHALRNALIPVVSVMALDLAGLFSGAVITETIFAWPGIGRMFVQAMFQRDYPVLMGILLMGSTMVVVFNLVADVVYGLLDPRIRDRYA